MSIPPAPGPTGYQPVAGEGFAYIDIEVRPSREFQTIGVTARYTFPEPRAYSDILQAYDEAFRGLEELADQSLEALIAKRQQAEAAPQRTFAPATGFAAAAPAQQAPTPTPVLSSGSTHPNLQYGVSPKGKKVPYLPTGVVSTMQMVDRVKQLLAAEGIPSEEVVVFDDRTGNYGLESGKQAYSAGKVKARKESTLSTICGDRNVAYVDFLENGDLKVALSKEGQTAKAALAVATHLNAAPLPSEPMHDDSNLPF